MFSLLNGRCSGTFTFWIWVPHPTRQIGWGTSIVVSDTIWCKIMPLMWIALFCSIPTQTVPGLFVCMCVWLFFPSHELIATVTAQWTAPSQSSADIVFVSFCACVCVRVSLWHACACVSVCVRVCVHACVCKERSLTWLHNLQVVLDRSGFAGISFHVVSVSAHLVSHSVTEHWQSPCLNPREGCPLSQPQFTKRTWKNIIEML